MNSGCNKGRKSVQRSLRDERRVRGWSGGALGGDDSAALQVSLEGELWTEFEAETVGRTLTGRKYGAIFPR
ncbi:hypothetical protein [Paenibacillus sedimenti]|uniref:Uncharacterized protein n=1 Tax=Paenibacillus sedimenti TaxID=2770274 RepID=A0A926QHZ5_9BACL|nr:hypothetical protein [Paenibacillus sedimenti]MBD0378792.1 hypothetical protein [Paenibacillus sedimenti]